MLENFQRNLDENESSINLNVGMGENMLTFLIKYGTWAFTMKRNLTKNFRKNRGKKDKT